MPTKAQERISTETSKLAGQPAAGGFDKLGRARAGRR